MESLQQAKKKKKKKIVCIAVQAVCATFSAVLYNLRLLALLSKDFGIQTWMTFCLPVCQDSANPYMKAFSFYGVAVFNKHIHVYMAIIDLSNSAMKLYNQKHTTNILSTPISWYISRSSVGCWRTIRNQ